MSWKEKNWPENVPPPENNVRSARIASFVREPRSRTGTPTASKSFSLAADAHAEDHPSAGHVVEDENSFATTLGCRSGSSTTAAPIVIRSVTAANVDSATTTSRIGLR